MYINSACRRVSHDTCTYYLQVNDIAAQSGQTSVCTAQASLQSTRLTDAIEKHAATVASASGSQSCKCLLHAHKSLPAASVTHAPAHSRLWSQVANCPNNVQSSKTADEIVRLHVTKFEVTPLSIVHC